MLAMTALGRQPAHAPARAAIRSAPSSRRWSWLTVGASIWPVVLLLAGVFAVRLRGIQYKALWWDEGLTVYFANLGLAEYLDLRWMDIHPPLYRLLMLGAVAVSGPTDFAIRYWSLALSIVAVALIYQLGRRIGGPTVGLLAAALAGLSPFVLYHAQEAKMYALLLVLTSAYLVAADRLLSGDHRRRWWLLAVASATLALWSHYYSGPTLLAVSLVYLIRWLRHAREVPPIRDWTLWHAVAVLLFLPWLIFDGSRIPADADRTIGDATLNPIVFGGEIWTTLAAGYPLATNWLGIAIAAAALLAVVLALADRSQQHGGRLLLATALFLPILVGVVVSIRFPYNAPRFFIVSAAPFAVLVAMGCASMARSRPHVGLLAPVAALALTALASTVVYAQPSLTDDYRPLLGELVEHYRPGDLVLCAYPWHEGYVRAYAPGVEGRVFPIPERFEALADRSNRIWVLYYLTPEGEEDFIRERFEGRGLRRTVHQISGLSRIALYERPDGA